MHSCNACDVTWGGSLTMHCAGCHISFTGLTAFDKHRTGSHAKGRYCLAPETAVEGNPESPHFGEPLFSLADRKYPCWTISDSPEEGSDD